MSKRPILALDFDDCIIPSDNTYFGDTDDSYQILELNAKRIKMMLEKYDMEVVITSSWSVSMKTDEFRNPVLRPDHGVNEYNNLYFPPIEKALRGRTLATCIEIGHYNRRNAIHKLLSEGRVVVAMDDMDLSDIRHDNYLFSPVYGFINNRTTYEINNFMIKKGFASKKD